MLFSKVDSSHVKVNMFVNMMKDLVSLLEQRFPDDTGILMMKTQINLTANTFSSPRLLVTTFMSAVQPYLVQIKEKDEVFFLDEASKEETVQCFQVGKKWHELSDEEKEAVWKSIHRLVVLGHKIVTEKDV